MAGTSVVKMQISFVLLSDGMNGSKGARNERNRET